MISRFPAISLLCLLAALLGGVGAAEASTTQRAILQDDAQVLRRGPEIRAQTLDELRALGVDTVKITVPWRSFAPDPDSERRPEFEAEDPAAYPDERWAPYDDAIRGAGERALEVFLMVAGPAPDWASEKSDQVGVMYPEARDFGRFVRAVGTRYSGSYAPGGSATGSPPSSGGAVSLPGAGAAQAAPALPRVSMWSIWNEPNLPVFLLPQRLNDRARTPISPHIYRKLLQAGHAGLSASGHASDTILIGELLPVGRASKGTRSSLRPIEFLREAACVDRRYRPFRGAAARRRDCDDFTRLPGTGIAHHPYVGTSAGPRRRPRHPDDVTIGVLPRLTAAADRLGARRRLQVRRPPVFLTEYGFQTRPPDSLSTPIRLVPGYLNESEFMAFRNPRIASYAQYPLVDDEAKGTGFLRFGGFQSGLRFEDRRAKPGVYEAYRLPFYARLATKTRVELFGAARTARRGSKVTIESRVGRASFRRLISVRVGQRGYFRRTLRVSRASKREFRFAFDGRRSRSAKARR